MRILIAVCLILLLAVGCGAASTPAPTVEGATPPPDVTATPVGGGELAKVTQIVDGDTINVSLNGIEYPVRYIGMDTPERGQPCFQEASAANAILTQYQTVRLVKDVSETDQYNRLLRYVYVGEVFVNAELVKQGWARAAEFPPDTAYAGLFASLEAEARAQGLGCWKEGVYAPAPTLIAINADSTDQTPGCDCSGNLRNCKDFKTHAEAQACLEYCKNEGAGDIHVLDGDSDGQSCETLPS